jgi:hypothetical protein
MKFLEVVKKAKHLFSLVKWSQEQLVNGMLIEYDGDVIDQASVIYLVSPDGEKSPLADGQYVTKSGTIFTITDGSVSSVDQKGQTPQESAGPTLQAQSKDNPPYGDVEYADPGYQEDKVKRYPIDTAEHIRAAWNYINKEENSSKYSSEDLQKIKDKIISAWKDKIEKDGPPSAESKPNPMSDKKDELKAEPATPVVEDPKEEAQETASIGQQITAAIAPVLEAINQLKESLAGTQDMAKSTKEDLSKVQETVEKLAAQPADIPKETKEIKNPFSSTKSDVKESRTYQILNSIQKP